MDHKDGYLTPRSPAAVLNLGHITTLGRFPGRLVQDREASSLAMFKKEAQRLESAMHPNRIVIRANESSRPDPTISIYFLACGVCMVPQQQHPDLS